MSKHYDRNKDPFWFCNGTEENRNNQAIQVVNTNQASEDEARFTIYTSEGNTVEEALKNISLICPKKIILKAHGEANHNTIIESLKIMERLDEGSLIESLEKEFSV